MSKLSLCHQLPFKCSHITHKTARETISQISVFHSLNCSTFLAQSIITSRAAYKLQMISAKFHYFLWAAKYKSTTPSTLHFRQAETRQSAHTHTHTYSKAQLLGQCERWLQQRVNRLAYMSFSTLVCSLLAAQQPQTAFVQQIHFELLCSTVRAAAANNW